MTGLPIEAVIAGSRSFALALLAPLTECVGTRPRIAADPGQALKLTGGAGLVVVEFQGDRSLEAIRQLVAEAAGVSVIAAVPDHHAGVEETLRALGVEPARWDGKPELVLSAVARRLAGISGRVAPAAVKVAPEGRLVEASAPAVRPDVSSLFDDLPLDDAPAPTPGPASAPAPAAPVGAPAPRATLASTPAGAWPSGVPSAAETGAALTRAVQGLFPPPGSPLSVMAEAMSAMSALERAVVIGEAQPFDPEPVRQAAIMRVRMAAALATAPPLGGGSVDAGATSALLGEIDALLSSVNALVAAAPEAAQPRLEQVRNALVKEAIDFSEVAHHSQSTEGGSPPASQPGVTTAAERKVAQTRVLSLTTREERQLAAAFEERRRRAWLVLAVAAILATGYHAYQWSRYRLAATADLAPTRQGAPRDATVLAPSVPGAPVVIRPAAGRSFTPEELRQIGDAEALRGNSVRVVGSSVVVLTGAPAQAPPGPPVAGGTPVLPAPDQGGGTQGTSSAPPAR